MAWTKVAEQTTTRSDAHAEAILNMVDDSLVNMVDDGGVNMVIEVSSESGAISSSWSKVASPGSSTRSKVL